MPNAWLALANPVFVPALPDGVTIRVGNSEAQVSESATHQASAPALHRLRSLGAGFMGWCSNGITVCDRAVKSNGDPLYTVYGRGWIL